MLPSPPNTATVTFDYLSLLPLLLPAYLTVYLADRASVSLHLSIHHLINTLVNRSLRLVFTPGAWINSWLPLHNDEYAGSRTFMLLSDVLRALQYSMMWTKAKSVCMILNGRGRHSFEYRGSKYVIHNIT